jgi:hypothetical protein
MKNKQYIQVITLTTGEKIQAHTNDQHFEPLRDQVTGDILLKNDTFQCKWQEIRHIQTILNPAYDPTLND